MKKKKTASKANDIRTVRIAYLVTHPIQYQAPLLSRIAQDPKLDLTVFFRSDFSTKEFEDPEFQIRVKWDTDLMTGYHYYILPAFGASDRLSFVRPFNYGLIQRLKNGDFDVLWVHGYAMIYHLYAIIMAKIFGMKVLIRDEATLWSKNRGKLNRLIKKAFFVWMNLICDGFLAIGTLNKDYYKANGIPSEKIFDMPYAVDNTFFQKLSIKYARHRESLRKSIGLKAGRPVVLYSGKLTQRKRPGDLLDAFSILVDILPRRPYLLFIGDGENRETLKNRAKELGVESDVFFLGFKKQNELSSYYDLCDVFVLPSFHEPWGLVINEAMNAGRAVIASDQVGSAYDLIEQGGNGFIFKAGDINMLAYVLAKVLIDEERCHKMGMRSLELISKWGFDEDVAGLKRAVESVLKGGCMYERSTYSRKRSEGPQVYSPGKASDSKGMGTDRKRGDSCPEARDSSGDS